MGTAYMEGTATEDQIFDFITGPIMADLDTSGSANVSVTINVTGVNELSQKLQEAALSMDQAAEAFRDIGKEIQDGLIAAVHPRWRKRAAFLAQAEMIRAGANAGKIPQETIKPQYGRFIERAKDRLPQMYKAERNR